MARKSSRPAIRPSLRIAPLGTLNACMVYEHELDLMAGGSSASLYLNFSLFLLGVAATLIVTLLSTTIPSDRAFYGFLTLAAVATISGLVLLALWWRDHAASLGLIAEIKGRMESPESPAVQEGTGDPRPGPDDRSPA